MDNKIDMTSLLCGETDKIDFEIEFAIDSADAPYGVTFPEAVKAKGSITNSGGYMRLCSEESARYVSECARCLRPIDDVLTIGFEKNVAEAGTVKEEDADDYLFIEDSRLDVESPLIEQIIVEFPSKILCREDCKGLCPRCGTDLNEGNCNCSQKAPDSRWASALAKIRDSLDEQN